MEERNLEIPRAWEEINIQELNGVLIVVGAPDAGKSTFARYLFSRLVESGKKAAFLDGDPGQSVLGPPTTMTLALTGEDDMGFPPSGLTWRKFVGSISPTGHMLKVIVGASRLIETAIEAGVEAIVYDTSGLVDPVQSGQALKLAKIDLLRPTVVFAIQYGTELEHLLLPLRRSRRTRIMCLEPSPAIKRRNVITRQAYRAERFAQYFQGSRLLSVAWTHMAIFPSPRFVIQRLVAFEDEEGYTLGLGVIKDIDRSSHILHLFTPLPSLERVDAIVLGDVLLDIETFRDRRFYLSDT